MQFPQSAPMPNINLWLGANLHRRKWTHHILYNDEAPPKHTSAALSKVEPPSTETTGTTGGHCKGILVWNDTHIGWLVHSTPKWPAEFTDPLPPIDAAQTEYGQSFVFIEAPIDKLPQILAQISLMGAHIYASTESTTGDKKDKKTQSSEVELAYGICWHVAKSPNHHIDFYDTYLPQFLGGSLTCQTWGRPLIDSTDRVKNIRRMQWTPDEPIYSTSQDHSKFAVSMDWRCPHVYIGDLNHMHSQEHRGGGGIIINDYALWQSLHDIILDYSSIEINKQKGQSRTMISWLWSRIRPCIARFQCSAVKAPNN